MFSLVMEGLVARIIIDRGAKRNAIPMASWAQLEALVRKANSSEAAIVLLEAIDQTSFCAGSDLAELHQLVHDTKLRRRFRGAMASATARLRAVNKPTIALVNGGCFGTGVSLAMACDIRIAGPNAEFAITPAKFGMSYPPADMQRLVELVGSGNAAAMVYSGLPIDGQEAHRIGLVEYVDAQGDRTAVLIKAIAANASVSLCTLKASMLGRFGVDERFDECFGSPQFAKAISSRARA